MDDNFTLLQIWQVEKNFMLYFNEINSYYELIKNDLEDYDQEDMQIMAIDIDNTYKSGRQLLFRAQRFRRTS